MKDLDVVNQSKAAYNQWCKQWREQAIHNSRHEMKDLLDFQNIGVGKACLVIANGHSFEKNLETIKKYQANVDILCVDKCLIPCLENGIVPTFVLVCDANVSYEKYMQPVEDKLQDSVLLMNVCGAPAWADHGNWKAKYFFVNKDVLKSEREFQELSGCPNVIPAGTNVSNAAVVMLTQCDEHGKRNFFGYDKLLLIGFDYCWSEESYYAFDRYGDGKRHYMKQVYCLNQRGDFVYTSPNLLFSAKWFEKYIGTFKIPAIQCSDESLVRGYKLGNLEEQMQYLYKPEDAKEVTDLLEYRRQAQRKIEEVNRRIHEIGRDHFKQLMRTI
jgi:hypothetical protein